MDFLLLKDLTLQRQTKLHIEAKHHHQSKISMELLLLIFMKLQALK